jgi:hypothetical protein
MKTLYALVIVATVVGCASIQPAPVQAGDRCLRCRHAVSDLRLAGEIIDNMRAPFPFRTAGCMAKYVSANAGSYTAVFVTDYHTGRMLPAANAWFVPTLIAAPDSKRTEPDYLAFGSRADAEAARTKNEPLLRWSQVVAEASAN